jgi:hypothetical protein
MDGQKGGVDVIFESKPQVTQKFVKKCSSTVFGSKLFGRPKMIT